MECKTGNLRKKNIGRELEKQKSGGCVDGKRETEWVTATRGVQWPPLHEAALWSIAHLFPHSLCFSYLFCFIKTPQSSFRALWILFFFFCGQEILDLTQKLFSSVNLSNTSCLSDKLVYPRGSYLANRQMAKSVKLVGVLLVVQDAHSQPRYPEARSQRIQKP